MAPPVTPNEVKKRSNPSWLDKFKLRVKKALGLHISLCDSCQWDWRSACHHLERPNATWCPDYAKKGK